MLNVHLNHPSCRTVGCIREPAKKSVENSTLGSDPPPPMGTLFFDGFPNQKQLNPGMEEIILVTLTENKSKIQDTKYFSSLRRLKREHKISKNNLPKTSKQIDFL